MFNLHAKVFGQDEKKLEEFNLVELLLIASSRNKQR